MRSIKRMAAPAKKIEHQLKMLELFDGDRVNSATRGIRVGVFFQTQRVVAAFRSRWA